MSWYKKDYYEKQALLRNLRLNKIIYSTKNEKTINSTKISKFLNYKFKFDVNLLESNFWVWIEIRNSIFIKIIT